VIVQIKPVKQVVPANLKRRCEAPYPKAQMRTGGDALIRGDENEAKLLRCSAKFDALVAAVD
jgi:hypothetical protein